MMLSRFQSNVSTSFIPISPRDFYNNTDDNNNDNNNNNNNNNNNDNDNEYSVVLS